MDKTQIISRKTLAEIYPTICEKWKLRIAELLLSSSDPEKIKVKHSIIEEAYKAADTNQKGILEKNFDLKFMGVVPRVSSLKEVYASLGVKREDVVPYKNPKTKLQKHLNADVDINHITRAMNGQTVLNWEDSNQGKYFPVFKKNGSGRWAVGHYDCWRSYSFLGSGLYYKSSDDALYAGRVFEDTYNDYLPE